MYMYKHICMYIYMIYVSYICVYVSVGIRTYPCHIQVFTVRTSTYAESSVGLKQIVGNHMNSVGNKIQTKKVPAVQTAKVSAYPCTPMNLKPEP